MRPKSVPDDAPVLGDTQAEIRLDELLDEMLGYRGTGARPDGIDGPPPIVDLRDTARRLRAASQWLPLPESRLAVRRALLVASHWAPGPPGAGRAAWRRAGMWLSAAAMIAIVGAWSLGAGTLDLQGPASSPMHALRLFIGKARVAWFPGPAQYALTYEFAAVRAPNTAGTTTINGTIGGLPVTLSLTAGTDACFSGTECGTFTISLAQLSAAAGARFGTMRGTFGCGADGACTLAFAEITGAFATIAEPTLSVNGTGQRAGHLTTKMASLNDWVATVTAAGQRLRAEGLLPAGLTVKDLATAAGTNGSGRRNNGDRSDGSTRHDVQNRAGSGGTGAGGTNGSGSPAHRAAGTGIGSTWQGAVQPGHGASSTTPARAGSIGHGVSHVASTSQERLPNGKISGGGVRDKGRATSSHAGGEVSRGRGPGTSGRSADVDDSSDDARGHGRGSSGGQGGSHDEHGAGGNVGRGDRGDNGSTDDGSPHGGSHAGSESLGSPGGDATAGGGVEQGGTGKSGGTGSGNRGGTGSGASTSGEVEQGGTGTSGGTGGGRGGTGGGRGGAGGERGGAGGGHGGGPERAR